MTERKVKNRSVIGPTLEPAGCMTLEVERIRQIAAFAHS